MAPSTFDLSAIATLRQRFDAGQSLTDEEVRNLFQTINTLCQGYTGPAIVRLSSDEHTALAAVHTSLIQALKQTGLHLQHETAPSGSKLPWVWFYRWDNSAKQGPYGTLGAAVSSAILQVRSGVLYKSM